MKPMIHTEGLAKHYGEKVAVHSLDLRVEAGELFCFLGPNGAGKTTTIKMLTGLLKPSRGRARLGGIDIEGSPEAAKALVGYIPDHPFLYDKLTGGEMLELVAGLYRMSREGLAERRDHWLETFGILPQRDELVESFSHGMRQKLSFAACFLHEPKIVIVDEPWVGLDPQNIRRIKTFLKEQTRRGLTVFMSTHTLSIAEELADRVGIIHQGRLLAAGTVEEVRRGDQLGGSSLEDAFLAITREAAEEGP